jgi:hypothetical protein
MKTRVASPWGVNPPMVDALTAVLLYLGAKLPLVMSLPMPTTMPWLSGEGAELPDQYRPVPLPRVGKHRLLPALPGLRHPRV